MNKQKDALVYLEGAMGETPINTIVKLTKDYFFIYSRINEKNLDPPQARAIPYQKLYILNPSSCIYLDILK